MLTSPHAVVGVQGTDAGRGMVHHRELSINPTMRERDRNFCIVVEIPYLIDPEVNSLPGSVAHSVAFCGNSLTGSNNKDPCQQ